MTNARTLSTTAALCAAVAASLLPNSSSAGVMSVADKTSISLPSPPTDQVDWRPYPHRHHRWHMGWHYGHPRFRYNPANAYGAANPAFSGCGVYGAASPTEDGAYDYGGGGLFTTGPGMF